MLDTKRILTEWERHAGVYERDLARWGMAELRLPPDEGAWSLGQLYVHLIGSALFMHLGNVERLLAGEGSREEGKTEAGEEVFASGSLPPIRIQVPPSPAYTPAQPESKEALVEGLSQVKRKMRELAPLLAGADASMTLPHPRLGGLNALEWYAMVEMHYRHHFRQKDRLEAFLSETEPSAQEKA